MPGELRVLVRRRGLLRRVLALDLSLQFAHAQPVLRGELGLAQIAVRDKCSVRELEAQIERRRRSPKNDKPAPITGLIRDSRLVINALRDTVRQLKRIGVPASSRVEPHGDYYDVIVTIRTPCTEK